MAVGADTLLQRYLCVEFFTRGVQILWLESCSANPSGDERLASTHAAAATRLLVATGCRRNEIPGLRWEDLDFDAGEVQRVGSQAIVTGDNAGSATDSGPQ